MAFRGGQYDAALARAVEDVGTVAGARYDRAVAETLVADRKERTRRLGVRSPRPPATAAARAGRSNAGGRRRRLLTGAERAPGGPAVRL